MASINLPQPHLNESIREHAGATAMGGHFFLSTAPDPLPDSKPLIEGSSSITRVHAVDNQAAVWRAGEAFIKAHRMDYPDVTREHVTLQFLKDQQPHGFEFPNVLYHFETDSRYFLVVSRVPGQLLHEAWPNMDETLRRYYVGKVANVCNYLAAWKGDIISGVDGDQLFERYFIKGNSKMADALAPQQLLKNCTEMCMDDSTLVFYHCDLGPTNLLVNVSTGSLGIIDWELAGYAPIEWVRTKFRLSAGMDFNYGDEESKKDWRRKVAQHLEKMGYSDVVDAWWKFQDSS
ncbi:hypothetical protein N7519_011402 [Penicillium mononematosum]|uniref:uncharacterized protein n=1 Tax=Penicillium mononematosum TaxID=268346 RepID=UPI0025470000|nr:uncharacterized protein N7519_011402 [Penicillium mononematosum]KAJ6180941.1 hypothetical protein N7519_011402 [Penicillium mononematosum]